MSRFKYIEMTYNELLALDREKTVFFSSISPVETHGEHLPMGTDIFLSEHLRDRMMDIFEERHADFNLVEFPTYNFGGDPIPVKGSIDIHYKAILRTLTDTGTALSDLGFKYWLLTDNHGGPHHQIAQALAAQKLWKKDFYLVAPFLASFRRMIGHDPDLLAKTGLGPGTCGDVDDAHGGTNETGLMLSAFPQHVRDKWKTTGKAKESPAPPLAKILGAIGKAFGSAGKKDLADEFHFLSHGLAWVSDPNMDPYQGDPSKASAEAGAAMLKYRAELGAELLEKAVSGNPQFIKPLGWSVRFLKDFM